MSDESREEIMAKAEYWTREGGAEFLLKLVNVYVAEAETCVLTLRRAYEEGNQPDLTRAAHTLKSSSANMGATTFSNLAKKIELASRQGRMEEMAGDVTRLEEEYPRVQAALEAVRVSLVK
jgi:HPt (histidine-containing phosphotransfer) domain-containing protein